MAEALDALAPDGTTHIEELRRSQRGAIPKDPYTPAQTKSLARTLNKFKLKAEQTPSKKSASKNINSTPDHEDHDDSITELSGTADQSRTVSQMLNDAIPSPTPTLTQSSSYPSITQVMDNLPPTQDEMKMAQLQANANDAIKELNASKAQVANLQMDMNRLSINLNELENEKKSWGKAKSEMQKEIDNFKLHKTTPQVQAPPTVDDENRKVRYFRGWRDIISPHHPCAIKDNDTVYRSQEHLYCDRKLKTHGRYSEATKARHMRFAGKVKAYTASVIPNASQDWENKKAKVMEEISFLRARQSTKYKEALLETGTDLLIHNMETDPYWGFGSDGNGQNILGNVSMNVRGILQSEQENPERPANKEADQVDLEVVSDSILSDIESYLLELDIKANVNSFSGKGVAFIAKKAEEIAATTKPKTLLIHMGTNSVGEEHFLDVQSSFRTCIQNVQWSSKDTNIILSGILHRSDKPGLNYRIDVVNDFLTTLENRNITHINHNTTFKNTHRVLEGQGLHLRPSGYSQVAKNIQTSLLGTYRQYHRPPPTRQAGSRENWGTPQQDTRSPINHWRPTPPTNFRKKGHYTSHKRQGGPNTNNTQGPPAPRESRPQSHRLPPHHRQQNEDHTTKQPTYSNHKGSDPTPYRDMLVEQSTCMSPPPTPPQYGNWQHPTPQYSNDPATGHSMPDGVWAAQLPQQVFATPNDSPVPTMPVSPIPPVFQGQPTHMYNMQTLPQLVQQPNSIQQPTMASCCQPDYPPHWPPPQVRDWLARSWGLM